MSHHETPNFKAISLGGFSQNFPGLWSGKYSIIVEYLMYLLEYNSFISAAI